MEPYNLDDIVKRNLTPEQLKQFNQLHYGREDVCENELKESTVKASQDLDLDVQSYKFSAAMEQVRKPRVVKLGLIQHSVVLPTQVSVKEQRKAIFNRIESILTIAAEEGVNIVCLGETWSMPFFLCTKEKGRWSEFAESATDGPSVAFLAKLAKEHHMVIVSPILEVDEEAKWWNTAVIINEEGRVLGKHRKNHLASVGSFSEASYYGPGGMGHPVFETKFGRIAVSVCFERHHALNWLMFALNGAEIVFNPAATVSEFGESFWGIEARNAAVANSYFTCGINRVGKEVFKTEDHKEVSRNYYGSSYVTAPNGYRTPGLSRVKDGLLVVEVDLNLCRQVKDQWGFQMTARLDLYAKELGDIVASKVKSSP